MPLPEAAARQEMLTRFLEPVRLTDAEMQLLIWLTDGMSGADIETLVAGGKRYLVLHSENGSADNVRRARRREALLAAIRRQATLNARLFDQHRKALLLGPEEELLDAVIEGAGLTQKEAAELMGVSQSTVSRRLKSNLQAEPQQEAARKE